MEVLDLRPAAARNNPYAELARVREAGPLCRVEPFGTLGVTRYDDVVTVLKNPKLFSSAALDGFFVRPPELQRFGRMRTLIGNDPPDHSRIRRLIQRAFTLQEMAAWEPRIGSITKDLIAESLHGKASFDFIGDFAMPLPVTVIAELLGVDPAHKKDFKRWSDDMVSETAVRASTDEAWRRKRVAELVQSHEEFIAYFEAAIAERRRAPRADMLSAIVRAGDEGQVIKPNEILDLTRLMLIAGNETTTNLLGNAMTALLRHPAQWRALVANPNLANQVVEETLRFDSPVLQLVRRVTQDTDIGGQPVAEGTVVSPLLASANHDPRRFNAPEDFDITRDASGHVAFGVGIHLCVGAPLARLEARIALQHVASTCPDLELTNEPPQWLEALFLRGHKTLMLKRSTLCRSAFEAEYKTRYFPSPP